MQGLSGADFSVPKFSINRPFFFSPAPAGRKITAGFSFLQRIGKSASIDVWFPQLLKEELDRLVAEGKQLGPEHFPAEWAAVRQFELLQEAGNYKIYDMDATHITRTLMDLTRNMRAGGYRVTVATLGSYEYGVARDDLEILDKRLQDRISQLVHMLYLEEQSEEINRTTAEKLASGNWDYVDALPHVGMVLGSRDLFRPIAAGRDLTPAERKHKLAQKFFAILDTLPRRHIVHDTAVGLQLPESINENEWIYLPPGDESFGCFSGLLGDLFSPFDKIKTSALDGRTEIGAPSDFCEIKGASQHMRGHGDRLTPEADAFYRSLAHYAYQ